MHDPNALALTLVLSALVSGLIAVVAALDLHRAVEWPLGFAVASVLLQFAGYRAWSPRPSSDGPRSSAARARGESR
jgi:hydrogenase/urease accessory protein HupE